MSKNFLLGIIQFLNSKQIQNFKISKKFQLSKYPNDEIWIKTSVQNEKSWEPNKKKKRRVKNEEKKNEKYRETLQRLASILY